MQAIARALNTTLSSTRQQELLEWQEAFPIAMMEKAIREHHLATLRSRKHHAFFFLDLPKRVRMSIYTYLFSEEPVTVCSFRKDYTGSFSVDERCQILMTNKIVNCEANDTLYNVSTFRFPSCSSLDYFTWHDVATLKLVRVQKIILTNRETVAYFPKHIRRFPSLKELLVDLPRKIRRSAALRPEGHTQLAKFVKQAAWYKSWIEAYLPTAARRPYSVAVVAHVLWTEAGEEKSEMCLIDMDRRTIVQDWRPVPPPVTKEVIQMPSADDSDVEIQELSAREVKRLG